MPKKTCPKCSKQHGTRKKVCDCGHSFGGGRAEPGWIADTVKGMPKVETPGPLPDGQMDLNDLREMVSYEGLGYCVWDLVPAERIADQKLCTLWRIARKAMQNVMEHLE